MIVANKFKSEASKSYEKLISSKKHQNREKYWQRMETHGLSGDTNKGKISSVKKEIKTGARKHGDPNRNKETNLTTTQWPKHKDKETKQSFNNAAKAEVIKENISTKYNHKTMAWNESRSKSKFNRSTEEINSEK